ncbi:MAG: bacterial ammonia monooxygenase, subunit AmoB [Burkholderiaceae bacterium]|nr:bacterial ammonia monooxygenase, subunit AmoB [Burkholderiaceae bacterium]
MSSLFRKLTLTFLAGMVLVLSGLPQPAIAHGERATEPYIRTRTIHWFDVTWSTDKLNVNDTVTVQGKFRLLSDWPDAVTKPHLVFLSNGSPGAVLTRVESYINDIPAQQSTKNLEVGRDYDFKLVMKGRKPGRWHLHPVMNIHGAGAIVGPGEWVTVSGSDADFKESVTTLHGTRIDDLQTFGVARVQMWQAGYALIAVAWLLWWLRRPLIISRWVALQKGREDLLVTRTDDKVAAGMLVLVLLVVIVGYIRITAEFPQLVPLQGGSLYTPPLPESPKAVAIKLKRAEYDVPGRSMRLSMEMTNHSNQPLSIGEFTTANLRFINKKLPVAVAAIDPKFPKDLIPGNGLLLDGDTPLAPGETRLVKLEATDAAWELERLVSFLSNVDSRTGGLIFFYDATGKRHISEVYGPIVPVFKKTI